MRKFAKLFDTKELGQILFVCTKGDEDHYQFEFHFDPNIDGLGLCKTTIGFAHITEFTEALQKAFDTIDETKAIDVVSNAAESVRELVWDEEY